MTKIENREQYEWALGRIEALVNDVTSLLGTSQSRVSALLSGKCNPTFELARSICRRLGISPTIVLGI